MLLLLRYPFTVHSIVSAKKKKIKQYKSILLHTARIIRVHGKYPGWGLNFMYFQTFSARVHLWPSSPGHSIYVLAPDLKFLLLLTSEGRGESSSDWISAVRVEEPLCVLTPAVGKHLGAESIAGSSVCLCLSLSTFKAHTLPLHEEPAIVTWKAIQQLASFLPYPVLLVIIAWLE